MRATAILPGADIVYADKKWSSHLITRRVLLERCALALPRPADIIVDRLQ
jgi:hypothetical protein